MTKNLLSHKSYITQSNNNKKLSVISLSTFGDPILISEIKEVFFSKFNNISPDL